MCVWYSIYIYNACDIRSSKQVTIMCKAWYLQLWWQENWILLCTACLVITLILERLLQHAEGVLDIQQAHENRTPVFSCWCVCVFSVLHVPCRCRQRKARRKGFLPSPANMCTSYLHTKKYMRAHIMSTHTNPDYRLFCMTDKKLGSVQYGALLCQLYMQESGRWGEGTGGRGEGEGRVLVGVTL